LEAVITVTTRVLCNDYTGPARLRLNMLEVASELKRIWHPCRMPSAQSKSSKSLQCKYAPISSSQVRSRR